MMCHRTTEEPARWRDCIHCLLYVQLLLVDERASELNESTEPVRFTNSHLTGSGK